MIPMLVWYALGASAAPVVQEEGWVTIEVRISSTRPRVAIVDRGTVDGLARLDRVVFRPRGGTPYEGTILRIDERVAAVELDDPAIVPQPGTRGEVRVPSSRRTSTPAAPAQPAPTSDAPVAPNAPEHPAWERTDEAWTPDQPLLAQVRPLRPAQRESRVGGRVYSFLDHARSTEGDRSDTFARLGTDLRYENPFGDGGDLHLDGEVNFRDTDVPDGDDERATRVRLDRLSYAWGGHRFAPDRFEVGRFLHHDVPEFGVLDGLQWSRRLGSGDTVGASVGFLPEPDGDQRTGEDLEFAGYYRWVADESELFALTGGYQKTFHDLAADRDLFVLQATYLPPDAWTFQGTAWVDAYGSTDPNKGPGVEVTQAIVTTGRRFDGGSSLRLTYTHLAFPEIARDEFLPVTNEQLARDRSDRVALNARQTLGRSAALFGHAGAWSDEDDEGTDGELGLEFEGLFGEDTRVEAAGFLVDSRFEKTVGWRAATSAVSSLGLWRLGYDFTLNDIDGFTADNDSIPQHRVRLSWEADFDSGWSFATYADVLLFDQEHSAVAGLFVQRSF